jgi:hypothetical protein
MSGVDTTLKLRDSCKRSLPANALPVAKCDASDTRSPSRLERNAAS